MIVDDLDVMGIAVLETEDSKRASEAHV